MLVIVSLIGVKFNSSSIVIQFSHWDNYRIIRSWKRGTTHLLLSVRYLEWISIEIVCNYLIDVKVLNNKKTNPPPSTVSIVLHKILGFKA